MGGLHTPHTSTQRTMVFPPLGKGWISAHWTTWALLRPSLTLGVPSCHRWIWHMIQLPAIPLVRSPLAQVPDLGFVAFKPEDPEFCVFSSPWVYCLVLPCVFFLLLFFICPSNRISSAIQSGYTLSGSLKIWTVLFCLCQKIILGDQWAAKKTLQ